MSKAAFKDGQKILAWNPSQNTYRIAKVEYLISDRGPAGDPYYMIDFGDFMSGRDESDLIEEQFEYEMGSVGSKIEIRQTSNVNPEKVIAEFEDEELARVSWNLVMDALGIG